MFDKAKIFLTLTITLLAISTDARMLGWQSTSSLANPSPQLTGEPFYIECKQVEHIEDNYICVMKKYQWVLQYIDAEYEDGIKGIDIQLEGSDEIKQKVKAAKNDIFFILGQVKEHEKVNISYIGMEEDPQGNLIFKPVLIPEQFKPHEPELPQILHEQIDRQFAHKRSHVLVQALILFIIFLVIVGLVYYWRRSQLSSKIDVQPEDLQEAMMAKMEVQKEANRKESVGVVRMSEPPPKSKLSTGV